MFVEQGGRDRAQGGFREVSRHPVDSKGRVFVPKRFLPGLPADVDGSLPVTLSRSPRGECLWLTAREEGTSALDPSALSSLGSRDLERLRLRSATTFDLTLDASKRILVPAELRALVGLGDEVVLAGIGPVIEVWDAKRWDAAHESALARVEEDARLAAERDEQEEERAQRERERELLRSRRDAMEEERLLGAEQRRAAREVAEARLEESRLELEEKRLQLEQLRIDKELRQVEADLRALDGGASGGAGA